MIFPDIFLLVYYATSLILDPYCFVWLEWRKELCSCLALPNVDVLLGLLDIGREQRKMIIFSDIYVQIVHVGGGSKNLKDLLRNIGWLMMKNLDTSVRKQMCLKQKFGRKYQSRNSSQKMTYNLLCMSVKVLLVIFFSCMDIRRSFR